MLRVPQGQHAVEKIHPAVHALKYVQRRAHTHEVAGLIRGHKRLHRVYYAVHFLGAFPHGKPADGVAVEVELRNFAHVLRTNVVIGATLIYSEQKLPGVHHARL